MMASVAMAGSEDLMLDTSDSSGENLSEVEELQRAIALEKGDVPLAAESAEPEVSSLMEGGLDSAAIEADSLVEDVPSPEPVVEQQSGRAERRIQKLVTEKKELLAQAEARDADYRRQLDMLQQQVQQQQQAGTQWQQQQVELQRQQMAEMQRRREMEYEQSLSPMERHNRQMLRQAQEQARGLITPEVQALRDELEGLKAERAKEREAFEQRQRYEQYNRETVSARSNLLKGFSSERSKQLTPAMDEMLLTYSATLGTTPEKAGPQFKKMLDAYAQGYLESRAANGRQMQKGQAVPSTAQGGRRSAQGGSPRPSWQALRNAGFSDYVDWESRGRPLVE